MFKGLSVYDFRSQFKTTDDCYSYLFDLKWGNGYQCSRCGHTLYHKGRTKWYLRCSKCKYDESVKANTMFHKMKLPILKAFEIMFALSNRKKGMSALEISRTYAVNPDTASLIRRKIQIGMALVNDLNNRLTNLENCLGNLLPLLCQINQSALQQNNQETQRQLSQVINVTLTNDENIVLNQNVPNPFAESTVITYSIPESVQKAQLLFYDAYGKLMKTVDINERGAGRVNVFGSDLSSGRYSYSLVADGNMVITKFMVKQ